VTHTVVLDLDDPGAVERVWMALQRRRDVRDIDPPLREAVMRRCERLDADVAEPILDQLDELHPELVLEAHFAVLVPNTPTVGAIGRDRSEP